MRASCQWCNQRRDLTLVSKPYGRTGLDGPFGRS